MLKNLVREYLLVSFKSNKDSVINAYIEGKEEFRVFTYTKGKKAIANLESGMVYTRNGLFYSVILKDLEYLESVFADHTTSMVDEIADINLEGKFDFLEEETDIEEEPVEEETDIEE